MKFYFLIFTGSIASLLLSVSCKPADYYYADYLKNGEISYPGRVDSLQVKPGNKRALLSMRISTDPKVVKLKILMRSSLESFDRSEIIDLTPADIGQNRAYNLDDLSESVYTFEVRSFDAKGDSSQNSLISNVIYGDRYRNALPNRIFESFQIIDEVPNLTFAQETNLPQKGTFYPMQRTAVVYTDLANESQVVYLDPYEVFAKLKDIKKGSTIYFSTHYKPEVNAIDEFESNQASVVFNLQAE